MPADPGFVCPQSFLYLGWYMVMSLLGHYNNFFFAAHLLDIAMGVKTLRTILSSVTHNGKQVWRDLPEWSEPGRGHFSCPLGGIEGEGWAAGRRGAQGWVRRGKAGLAEPGWMWVMRPRQEGHLG